MIALASPVKTESKIFIDSSKHEAESPLDCIDAVSVLQAPMKKGSFRPSKVYTTRLRLDFEKLAMTENVVESMNVVIAPPAPLKLKTTRNFKMNSVKRHIEFEEVASKRLV